MKGEMFEKIKQDIEELTRDEKLRMIRCLEDSLDAELSPVDQVIEEFKRQHTRRHRF